MTLKHYLTLQLLSSSSDEDDDEDESLQSFDFSHLFYN